MLSLIVNTIEHVSSRRANIKANSRHVNSITAMSQVVGSTVPVGIECNPKNETIEMCTISPTQYALACLLAVWKGKKWSYICTISM